MTDFDCELPDDALDELLAPRRPRILGRPVKGPHGRRVIVLAVLALVLLAAGVVVALVSWQRQYGTPAAAPDPILEHSKALLVAQETQPVPGWQSDGTASGRAGVIPEVRWAELVPVTVKRATLLRLPSQELGVYKWYDLPSVWGGGRVWARYMGTVGRFSEIPPNPAPGDLWNVTETENSWIFCTPAGYDHAAWIDP